MKKTTITIKGRLITIGINVATFIATTLIVASAGAQTINTVAGSGLTSGFSGDGGAATAAVLNTPANIAISSTGEIIFSDLNNQRIRKISNSGVISTIAGDPAGTYPGDGGAATAAALSTPTGVATDASGNVYIADFGSHMVRKVSTSGIITTIAGTGVAGSTGDGGPASSAKLNGPYGVAVDASNNIYIADRYNNKIRKIDASGIITTFAGDGTTGSAGDGGAATAASMSNPLAVAVDGSGNVYIVDYSNVKVRKVNTSGVISTFAGIGLVGFTGDGGPATNAKLAGPITVATDVAGNVYIGCDATTNGNRVRKVTTTGTISTVAGTGAYSFTGDGGPATAAAMGNVKGVAVNAAGHIFISDAGSHRIRKVTVPNTAPSFIGGATQTMSTCQNATSVDINSYLTVHDTDQSQLKIWSIVTAPTNGTISGAYSTTTSGTALATTGLSYSPTSGYTGSDAFAIQVYDGDSYDTTTITVAVNALPVPVITVAGSTLSTSASFTTYQWLSGSTPIPGATSSTYAVTTPGSYAVTVTNVDGCTGTSALQTMPATGVADVSLGGIKVYPNPVTEGACTISIPSNKDAHVLIYNMFGQVVREIQVGATTAQIEMNIPGMYQLVAVIDGQSFHTSIVVQ